MFKKIKKNLILIKKNIRKSVVFSWFFYAFKMVNRQYKIYVREAYRSLVLTGACRAMSFREYIFNKKQIHL